jgi:hypothetical protein
MTTHTGSAARQRVRFTRLAESAVERARLTVVPRQRPTAPRTPFVILVATVLLGGVVLLLMFNTSMQQASFKATRLEERATLLNAKEQQLRMELDMLRDPQRVSEEAASLGMVPMVTPAFLRLSDGTVLGVAAPATGDTRIRLKDLPPRMPDSFKPKPEIVYAPVDPGQSQSESEGTGAPGLLQGRDEARSEEQSGR